MKKLLILSLLFIFSYADEKTDAMDYLNTLRQSAGLAPLSYNQSLDTSAQNHADYLEYHISNSALFYGHDESPGTTYYTGTTPVQRAFYAGYKSSYVLENLSSGQADIYDSIDGLMSAIYHRFGFLDLYIDEIGIGLNNNNTYYPIFNYNMGNSLLNELCNGTSYTGTGEYYYSICSDSSLKIESSLYTTTKNQLASTSPKYIIWPPSASNDIPTRFYEETPDPLPNYGVSGYPVSIEFNDYFYNAGDITLSSFKLYNANGTEITDTLVMTNQNDPNGRHTQLQFTLFPLSPLESNQIYSAQFNYALNGISKSISWEFLTRSFPYPYYTITSSPQSLYMVSGKKYAIYLPPQNGNDIYNSWETQNCSNAQIDFHDSNTLYMTLSGTIGQGCQLYLSYNGTNTKTMYLNIAATDTATVDTTKTIDSQNFLSLSKGWNLISADMDLSTLPVQVKILWQYNEGSWSVYSEDEETLQNISDAGLPLFNTVSSQNGMWAFMTEDKNITISANSETLAYTYSKGWNLAGTNTQVNVSQLSCTDSTYFATWKYNAGSWKLNIADGKDYGFETFDTVNGNEGFWVNCK